MHGSYHIEFVDRICSCVYCKIVINRFIYISKYIDKHITYVLIEVINCVVVDHTDRKPYRSLEIRLYEEIEVDNVRRIMIM